jgi:L-gulonate 5-dehydrogenase
MRAAKLVELKKIEIVDVPVPDIASDTDVQVQVKAVGVCGTDLHMFHEARTDVKLPRIMGHELSGLVTKVGKGVTRVSVGDRVALDPVFACGECPTCKKGHQNVCSTVTCYGVQMEGGYQDYIVVSEEHLYPFDESITYEQAALAEPFSIASNILHRAQLTNEDTVLIIGSGTIGMALVQVAKMIGARLMVSDVITKKLEIAKSMGADAVVNSKEESLKDAAAKFAPYGFDVVIDAVGITPLFQESLGYAAPCARVMCIGFDSRPVQLPPILVTKKELSIIGSRMNCYRFPVVMEWLREGKIQADKMISMKFSINDIQKAFEETLADSAGNVKTMISFD